LADGVLGELCHFGSAVLSMILLTILLTNLLLCERSGEIPLIGK
jgi:hypothetical protein